MHNEFQTAANSKNHVGDAPVQISLEQIDILKNSFKEACYGLEWARNVRADSEIVAWWQGRKDALRHVFAELGINAQEEI